MNNNLILMLVAAAAAGKMTLERTTAAAEASPNALNIATETFDLIDADNRWQGALSLFANGQIMVEKGGKYNWVDRYPNIAAFRKAICSKAA